MDEVLIMQNIIITFLILLGIFLGIYLLGKKHSKKRRGQEIYACGEDIQPEHLNLPDESFYQVFIKKMRIEWLRRAHTGNISDYLAWMVLGLVFIIILLSVLW